MVQVIDAPAHKRLHVVAGRFNRQFAADVAHHVGVGLTEANVATFANGEVHCRYDDSIRGGDVFIVQGHGADECGSVNDALMEQLIMVDAARRASAKRITVVCPFYGYARQDRKSEGREPITARLIADMFEVAGAKRMVSIDLHSGQIQGFFSHPVDHLTAMPVLAGWLETLGEDLVVVSPDSGRVKNAERYAKRLHAGLAIVYKRRIKGEKNAVEAQAVVGEVVGRTCVLIDDMIDTAGTMCAAANQLHEEGAARVLAAATHGVLSGPAIDRIKNSVIEKLVITDTLPLPPEKQIDKIEVLSVAPIVANAIRAVFDDNSVSEIFDGDNLS
ncbi:MAG: ribose-phosphate diphosphokinase [Acidimicrobiia bacterium]|nr:ribose-phosphate diphosphokinase [Acidimicrobiia bacterium]